MSKALGELALPDELLVAVPPPGRLGRSEHGSSHRGVMVVPCGFVTVFSVCVHRSNQQPKLLAGQPVRAMSLCMRSRSVEGSPPRELQYLPRQEFNKRLYDQERRLDLVQSALDESGEDYALMRTDVASMMDELQKVRQRAGQLLAQTNAAKATTAVQNLADTFAHLDRNRSGDLSVDELANGLGMLGLDSHSQHVRAIMRRYSSKGAIDVKRFAALVRDVLYHHK